MKQLLFLTLVLLLLFFSRSDVLAGEGTFLLRSTNNESYRCYVSSIQMQDKKYTLLVSCRDLIYPANSEILTYVLWSRPTDGSKPVKLGTLNFGRVQFRASKEFSSLFVTTEPKKDVKQPGSQIVMRGNIETISFLQRPTTPSPTPKPSDDTQEEETTPEKQVLEPTPVASTREKLTLALQRAGIAAGFALVALIGLIFVITRSRG